LNGLLLKLTEMVSKGAERAVPLDMAIMPHAPHQYNLVNALDVDVKSFKSSI
jgi:hypothetical protein